MAYRTRSSRRLARKTKHNLLATIVIILVLLFVTINWILPFLINSLGFLRGFISHPQNTKKSISENPGLAPPVISIPFEATNSAQIDIKGYAGANSKVKLYLDDEAKATADTLDDGSFTFKNINLNLGVNNIYAKTLDEKDQVSLASKLIRVIYDSEKPPLTVNEPEDNKKIQGGDKKIKISGKTEIGAKVYVNDNQIIVDKDGNFSNDLPINEGDNFITIKALDPSTNQTELQRKVTYSP